MSTLKQQCDYAMAVVKNAREAGMSRQEFINLVKMAWDAQEMAQNAPLLTEGKGESHGS